MVWSVRVGVGLSVLIVLALAGSFRWAVFRTHWERGEYSTLAFERGAATYQVVGPSLMMNGGAVVWHTYDARKGRVTGAESGYATADFALRPVWGGVRGHQRRLASVPLWIPLAAILIPTLLLRRRLRGLAAGGACPACGYDLAGLAAAVPCPECGELLN